MFDEFLKKGDFVSKYKMAGYSDGQIDRDWQKVEQRFISRCLDEILNALPEEKKAGLRMELMKVTKESFEKFIKDLESTVDSEPGLVDVVGIMKKVSADVMKNYQGGV